MYVFHPGDESGVGAVEGAMVERQREVADPMGRDHLVRSRDVEHDRPLLDAFGVGTCLIAGCRVVHGLVPGQ